MNEREKLSLKEVDLLHKRRDKRLAGESKTYPWEEVKSIIIDRDRNITKAKRG